MHPRRVTTAAGFVEALREARQEAGYCQCKQDDAAGFSDGYTSKAESRPGTTAHRNYSLRSVEELLGLYGLEVVIRPRQH